MKKIIKYSSDLKNIYYNKSFWARVKDAFYLRHDGDIYIKSLDVIVKNYRFPSNFDDEAYVRNVNKILKKNKGSLLCPQSHRLYDYKYSTDFQKKALSYSIVESVRSILRLQKKSLFNACIVINNAEYDINRNIIYEISKWCKYIVLVSEWDNQKNRKIFDYLVSNFGVSPIITDDIIPFINKADFIITATPIYIKVLCPIWLLDNSLRPSSFDNIHINNVSYKTEWADEDIVTPELLGAFFEVAKEKSIEKAFENNKVYLDKIKFDNKIIEL
ncbi:hypothetical protein SH2C18_40720 [Clostridium sediminicola]|uniref:hypothetical protein n=1 Tax=Clostridium sediminicola TaxID=3114879 RepID=UPI0031F1D72C